MKWIFFDEGREDSPDFEVEAPDYKSAYWKAFDSYGPQVQDMYYKQKDPLTFYQVITSDHGVKGTFENFGKALEQKEEGDTIRYWSGSVWVLNVTEEQ